MREMIIACEWNDDGIVNDMQKYSSYVLSNYTLNYFQHITDVKIPMTPNVNQFLIRCDDSVADAIWQDDNIFVLQDVQQ